MLETINLTVVRLIHAVNASGSGSGIALACGLGVLALVCLFR